MNPVLTTITDQNQNDEKHEHPKKWNAGQTWTCLLFDGRREEAIEFHRRTFGAEVMMMRFMDSPEPPQPGMCPPDSGNKIMHASLRIGAPP